MAQVSYFLAKWAKSRPGWPLLFLVTAVSLHFIYLAQFDPLKDYWHAPERYLHIAYLATPIPHDSVKVSSRMLGYVLKARTEKLHEYDSLCPLWHDELGMDFCKQVAAKQLRLKDLPHENVAFIEHFNPASYPPAAYFPYIFGAQFAATLDYKPREILQTMTFFGSMSAILVGYIALRLLPIMRLVTFFFLLTPAVCTMRIYPMPDGLLISAVVLLFAAVLRLRTAAQPISWIILGFLMALAGWIAYAKLAYFWVAGIVFLLPHSCFKNKADKWRYGVMTLTLCVLLSAGWAWQAGSSTFRLKLDDMLAGEKVQGRTATVSAQLNRIFNTPEDFVWELGNAMFSLEAVQRYITLGWNRPNLGKLPLYERWLLFLPLLVLPLWPVPRQLFLGAVERAWCLGLYYAGFITILTLNYLFIDYGLRDFSDMRFYNQGRYFIPMLPVLMLALSGLGGISPVLGRILNRLYPVIAILSLAAIYVQQKVHLGF